jgi:hypothetical protein
MYSVQPLHFEKVYNKSSVLSTTNSHTAAAAVFVVVVGLKLLTGTEHAWYI